MKIGTSIAKRRKELHLSQEQLAEKADISQTHISKIELGKDNPSLDLLERIATALDCELFIELVPFGAEVPTYERETLTPEEPEHRAPTWVTLENARALTIFGIAYQKLELEKNSLSDSERKALEGIIETCLSLITTKESNSMELHIGNPIEVR